MVSHPSSAIPAGSSGTLSMLASLLSPIYTTPLNLMASDTIPVLLYHRQARPLPRPPAIMYPVAHPSPPLDYRQDISDHTWPNQPLPYTSFHQLLPFPSWVMAALFFQPPDPNLEIILGSSLSLYTGYQLTGGFYRIFLKICPEADCSSPPPL